MKLEITTLVLLAARLAIADDAPPPPHALVVHVPPTETVAGEPIELEAMIDAPFAESLSVRWRAVGQADWRDVPFERSSAGGWFASLPPAAPPGVEYYIRGKDGAGGETLHFASPEAPHVVRVDPALYDRLEALDRERLGGLVDEVSIDVAAHDFGNRYGLSDQFLRGELVYTHRILRVFHDIGFGFGTINGKTPLMSSPDSDVAIHDLRYGFGQVRLRVHPSVFLDGRISLGASNAGFEQGVRGQVTFGKPWRSALQLGGEYLGDLGGSGWVRLQWDTAPPLLMGASVVRTDLPGAVLSRFGLYIAYDLAYRMTERLTFRAQLSYGTRDGGDIATHHFGGGLGTAVAF